MSLYRPIITTAWRLATRSRRLWWFAFFGGLLVGSGFGSAALQTLNADPTRDILARVFAIEAVSPSRLSALWTQALATGPAAAAALAAYGVFLLTLFAFIVWLAVIGLNAIVVAASSHASQPPLTLRELRRSASARFWPAFAVHVVAKIAEAILLTAWGTVLVAFAMRDAPFVNARTVLAFVVTVIIIAILHIVTPYAIAGVVLDRRNALTALREAFAIIRDHWFIVVEASLLLTAAHIAAMVIWLAGNALLALPFHFLDGIAIAKGIVTLFSVSLIGRIITLAVWLAVVAMIFTTFLVSAWTLLFLRLSGPGERPEPWIMRATSRKLQTSSRAPNRL